MRNFEYTSKCKHPKALLLTGFVTKIIHTEREREKKRGAESEKMAVFHRQSTLKGQNIIS